MRIKFIVILIALFALFALPCHTWNFWNSIVTPLVETVTVDIKGVGTIVGRFERTSWSRQIFMEFLGIPYAAAPSGRLRFKAPAPRQPWKTPYNATRYGRPCPEISTFNQITDAELDEDLEDCLSLCIYTKCLHGRSAVIVYLHGGGAAGNDFNHGSSADYPARYLLEKNIVLVVPQYRLGALGWLSTGTGHMPGNVAIADVLFALDWIRQHIAEFGGDPELITLMGHSGGAVIAGAILLSPLTPRNLVKRAILQSGSILSSYVTNPVPHRFAESICLALKCSNCQRPAGIYRCLRNMHVLHILEVTREYLFTPIIGDRLGILPRYPNELLENFDASIPLLTGFTKHDGTYIFAMLYDSFIREHGNINLLSVRDIAAQILNRVNIESDLAAQAMLSLLFTDHLLRTSNHIKAMPAYFDLTSVVFIKSPIISLASYIVGNRTSRVYLYSFDYEGQHTRFSDIESHAEYPFLGGVHHADENIYLFSTHKLGWRDTELAKRMVNLWTTFAQYGTPRAHNLPTMKPMKNELGPYFHIDRKITFALNVLNEFRATLNDPSYTKLIR